MNVKKLSAMSAFLVLLAVTLTLMTVDPVKATQTQTQTAGRANLAPGQLNISKDGNAAPADTCTITCGITSSAPQPLGRVLVNPKDLVGCCYACISYCQVDACDANGGGQSITCYAQ
jgi:hypothetical protein